MKCGVLSFSVLTDDSDTTILAYMDGKRVGRLILEPGEPTYGVPVLQVGNSIVAREHRRCGIGTQLYERALQFTCKNGALLASDTYRSDYSEGFWHKQARKERARCVRGRERGRRLPEGTWPCYRYVMRQKCPRKLSLRGRR